MTAWLRLRCGDTNTGDSLPSCSNKEEVEEEVSALEVLCELDVLVDLVELSGLAERVGLEELEGLAERSKSKELTELDELLLALEILITLEELDILMVLCLSTSFDSLSTFSASNASISLSSLRIG